MEPEKISFLKEKFAEIKEKEAKRIALAVSNCVDAANEKLLKRYLN